MDIFIVCYFLFLVLFWFVILKFKWLSSDGNFAAIGIVIVFYLANWSINPLLTFLVLGTLTGKLNKGIKTESKHSKPRDAYQVLANGGVAACLAICSVFFHQEYFKTLMFISIAVSCSDTLSSEIGMRFGRKTFGILTFKSVPKGLSGGVSIQGFLGAIIGSLVIAIFDIPNFILIFMFGIMGSILDSILGSLLQAKYKFNGELSDVESEYLVAGYKIVNNDAVNILTNVIITISALLLLK